MTPQDAVAIAQRCRLIARFALLAPAILLCSPPANAQTAARVTGSVDDSVRVVLADSVHPLARPEFAGERVTSDLAMDRMILLLDAGPEADAEMRATIDRLHTPGSPDFHHWLTPDEFGARFGANPEDIRAVREWLGARGFRIDSVARGGRVILFSGTVRQVEEAFQTEMRHFAVRGEDHIANARAISIPAALAPAVKGVVSLDNFFSEPLAKPSYVSSGQNGVTPGDFASIYDLAPLYKAGFNGSGQRIGLIERSDFNPSDYANYRIVFGLPPTQPNVIFSGPDPGFPVGTDASDYFEAEWDPQQAGGVAPGAIIDVIISGSTLTTDGVRLSALYAVEQNQDSVLSMSFAKCEQDYTAAQNAFILLLWAQASAQGISAVVSTGDTGAAQCDSNDPPDSLATHGLAINGLGSTPWNTSVGGSEFDESAAGSNSVFWNATNGPDYTSVRGYIPEMVWNESCNGTVPNSPCPGTTDLGAGGGGASVLYSKPPWQMLAIPGIPQDGVRDVPDISLSAASHDNYEFCFNGSCQNTSSPTLQGAAGVSFGVPSFAGIMAIIDQKMGGRQGLANYALYAIAATESFANCNSSSRTNPAVPPSSQCPFNDITVGNNSVPGLTGYTAGVGYDLASGWAR
jgi:subtilase family serine protease